MPILAEKWLDFAENGHFFAVSGHFWPL